VHGDFHTNNVFIMNDEPLLIDMDRVSRGHPIIEISDLYYFYVVLGEDDPSVIENFMGFSYETSKKFFDFFLRDYLGTDDENRLNEVIEKATLLCCTRLIRKLRRSGEIRVSHFPLCM
jgi:aminoglycoside phosphotransferase (APT) family kinase protein